MLLPVCVCGPEWLQKLRSKGVKISIRRVVNNTSLVRRTVRLTVVYANTPTIHHATHTHTHTFRLQKAAALALTPTA